MPVAFVTGASGFLGQHLVDALRAEDWQVLALCRPGAVPPPSRPGVEWVAADLTAWRQVRNVMPAGVDAVFHAAYNISLWQGDAEVQTRLNVFGTRNVARAALETRAKRFIHSSSIVAYGLHGGIITEETPSRAARSGINLVRSMAHGEREVRRALRQGLPAVILNPAHLLGARDAHGWGRILQLVQNRRVIAAAAGGGSFCHVRAVAAAHVQAVRNGRVGQNYLMGGVDLTYLKLLRLVGERLGKSTLPWSMPKSLLSGYARVEELLFPALNRPPDFTRDMIELFAAHSYCRSRKAMEELGYQPASLEEMLDDCIAWLRHDSA